MNQAKPRRPKKKKRNRQDLAQARLFPLPKGSWLREDPVLFSYLSEHTIAPTTVGVGAGVISDQ